MRHPIEIRDESGVGRKKRPPPAASHPQRRAIAQRNHSLRMRHKPASPANKKAVAFPAREHLQAPESPNHGAPAFHAQPARNAVHPHRSNQNMTVRKRTETRKLLRAPSPPEMCDV